MGSAILQPKHCFYCQSVLLPLVINHTDVGVPSNDLASLYVRRSD
jgi:hypothetical protein